VRRLTATAIPLAALATCLLLAPAAGAAGAKALLAPNAVCPGQGAAGAPSGAQEQTMLCLTNYARRAVGLRALRPSPVLEVGAGRKSGDIIRCDEFSHFACRRGFSFWRGRSATGKGCNRVAENIAWGTGTLGTPRAIFLAWMRSGGHRANILGHYGMIGVGLRVGSLDGFRRAHVWTQQFGSDCSAPRVFRLKRAVAA
jgi:uncharacterized protein YkwD